MDGSGIQTSDLFFGGGMTNVYSNLSPPFSGEFPFLGCQYFFSTANSDSRSQWILVLYSCTIVSDGFKRRLSIYLLNFCNAVFDIFRFLFFASFVGDMTKYIIFSRRLRKEEVYCDFLTKMP